MTPPRSAWLRPQEVVARLTPGQAIDELMCALLPWAVAFADATISKFPVGAIAFGGSGALYAGANLEFTGMPLSASVHAEQAALMNAWSRGEREVSAIAATAVPCGHCRQFLMELGRPERLAIYVAGRPAATLADLLPSPFGPGDLGAVARLLDEVQPSFTASIDADDVLGQAALGAARASYAPYTRAHAGIALQTADGTIVTGVTPKAPPTTPASPRSNRRSSSSPCAASAVRRSFQPSWWRRRRRPANGPLPKHCFRRFPLAKYATSAQRGHRPRRAGNCRDHSAATRMQWPYGESRFI